MTLPAVLNYVTWGVFSYFIAYNLSYLFLNMLAIFRMHGIEQGKILAELPHIHTGLEPPISILFTTRNEASIIAASVQSLLQLEYPQQEIIVINDGSQDETIQILTAAFDLHPFPEAYRIQLTTQAVSCIYRSTRYPSLRVIDKEYGGTADALNAGINASRYPLFCNVDAATILHRDSLKRIVTPFLNDNTVIAAVSAVRVANGCEVENGLLKKVALPKHWLALFQIVEYLRSTLFAPLGWSMLNGMLMAPAGMTLFRKASVIAVGGYRRDTRSAGTELIVRMHRLMRKKQQTYRIRFIADPVCWHQVPQNLTTLKSHCIRWQQGLADSLSQNMALMFSRNGGVPGRIVFPFFLLFEWSGPILEFLGYVFMLIAFACGLVSWQACIAFLSVAIGLGILLSASTLLLEEMSFHLYPTASDIATLTIAAVISNLGYRQLTSTWRALGMLRWMTGRPSRHDAIEYVETNRTA
ncbi:glycosyltransferase family 2 protein [Herminiimonas arsenitoxidans]|uniref:glycosyltransferase family 2 protein n=1 Tax=Herminiimonas arsenitoxidans TaxID=1809410 RepID=UPI000971196B|nr:glycosyltransferase [Herminiimonas arsenitoxidans]